MTPATPQGSGPNVFSPLASDGYGLYRVRGRSFALSVVAQALVMVLLVVLSMRNSPDPGPIVRRIDGEMSRVAVVFSRPGGGGGGGLDKIPAARGAVPPASLDNQLTPPTVFVPREMPKLPVPETVMVAPEIKLPQGGQYGDPLAKFSSILSNGTGGPGGIGIGCCNGVGPSNGPGVGPGPGGIYIAGARGVTVPRPIYSPEPAFSDEARKEKAQGMVVLLLVVAADGRTRDIRVRVGLGMGLDENAIEAVRTWKFIPAMLNGKPVDSQIEVEVNFHLY